MTSVLVAHLLMALVLMTSSSAGDDRDCIGQSYHCCYLCLCLSVCLSVCLTVCLSVPFVSAVHSLSWSKLYVGNVCFRQLREAGQVADL